MNYKGAIADYDKAIKLDPKYISAYYNRGLAKYDLKDYEGASSDFDKANELNPELKNPNKA